MQALLAFGTGGLRGLGLGLSRQKWFYLPEAHTDFIFAMVGEEAGLIGTFAVVAAFIIPVIIIMIREIVVYIRRILASRTAPPPTESD